MESAFFVRTGAHTFAPTSAVTGAWSQDEQHVAPVIGLVTHLLEAHAPRADLLTARLTHEILGTLAHAEVTIEVATVRPGRTIELVEATASIGGRAVLRSRAWRLQRSDTAELTGDEFEPIPTPDECSPFSVRDAWPPSVMDLMEFRAAPGGRPGRRAAWVRSPIPLLTGEPITAIGRFAALIDFANGIAVRRQPQEWAFPNVELSIHLLREPDPAWTGLDTRVAFGAEGIGLTSSVLHDVHGPVGRCDQALTLRRR